MDSIETIFKKKFDRINFDQNVKLYLLTARIEKTKAKWIQQLINRPAQLCKPAFYPQLLIYDIIVTNCL